MTKAVKLEIADHFSEILTGFLQSQAMTNLTKDGLGIDAYRSWCRQTYYYVRENPQIQAVSTAFFRGKQRFAVRGFFKHALSEIGHEQLALNDFETLGGDPSTVPYRNPLPATTALTSFAYYNIYNLNSVGYLGYLYFLEHLPTSISNHLGQIFDGMGIPQNARTFFDEHVTADLEHNKMMERYIDQLVKTGRDLESVKHSMTTTSYLFDKMLLSAFDDALAPADTGWNWEELDADGLTPNDFGDTSIVQRIA